MVIDAENGVLLKPALSTAKAVYEAFKAETERTEDVNYLTTADRSRSMVLLGL